MPSKPIIEFPGNSGKAGDERPVDHLGPKNNPSKETLIPVIGVKPALRITIETLAQKQPPACPNNKRREETENPSLPLRRFSVVPVDKVVVAVEYTVIVRVAGVVLLMPPK